MIEATASEAKAGCNILQLEVRQLFEYLLSRQAGGQEIENVRDPNPHAADARATATLLGVHRDPIGKFSHGASLERRYHKSALS